MQEDNTVHFCSEVKIVGCDQSGSSLAPRHFDKLAKDGLRGFWVQIAGGLISKQKSWCVRQRAGYGHSLLFAP